MGLLGFRLQGLGLVYGLSCCISMLGLDSGLIPRSVWNLRDWDLGSGGLALCNVFGLVLDLRLRV